MSGIMINSSTVTPESSTRYSSTSRIELGDRNSIAGAQFLETSARHPQTIGERTPAPDLSDEEKIIIDKLCKRIAVEQDPVEFTRLVTELNDLLENKQEGLDHKPKDN
jgi:hypothetical protein